MSRHVMTLAVVLTMLNTTAAWSVDETGPFAGKWHSTAAEFRITKVNQTDRTFTGSAKLLEGTWKGWLITFDGSMGVDYSMTLTRNDRVDAKGYPDPKGTPVSQSCTAGVPKKTDKEIIWSGVTTANGRPDQKIGDFELTIPIAALAGGNNTGTPAAAGDAGSVAAADTGSSLNAKQAQEVVDYHNEKRKEVGVGALKWSSEIAKVAQAYADKLAESGEFAHSGGKYGENLAWRSGGGGVSDGVKSWYAEKSQYTPGTKIDNSNYLAFGHYTQMVWKNTTEIGVGVAVYKNGPMKGSVLIVANYGPGGNIIGQTPY